MSGERRGKTNRMMTKTLLYGFLLAAFYLFAFLNAGAVMRFFSAPSWYAALGFGAIAVFLHAAFAVSLVSSLRARTELRRAEERSAAMKKRTAQRARPRAYINPWHNI